MGSSDKLIQYQVGTQSSFATGVSATAKLSGIEEGALEPVVESMAIEESRGSLRRSRSAELVKVEGAASLTGAVCFEDAPYWFDSLLGEDTPSGGGPYTYDYSVPGATAPSPRILSLYRGLLGAFEYRLVGGLVDELKFTIETGQPWKFDASFLGHSVKPAALASLSDRAATWVMAQDTELYIDAFGGTIGTTQISGLSWFKAELTLNANRVLDPTIQQLEPLGYHEDWYEGELMLSMELNAATSKAYLDAILNASAVFERLVRIKATSGTNELTLDFAGFAEEAPEPITEQDGLISLEFTLLDEEESGLANWFIGQVVNNVSSMP